jgi:hydrogenase nickel incorporation protein HypA/HybF
MHELSVAQNIISIVKEYLPDGQKNSLKRVKVKIGKLSNILPDSLLFGFNALIKETNLEGAKLEIEHTPLKIKCSDCRGESDLEEFAFNCPACSGNNIQVISGDELTISEIEIED